MKTKATAHLKGIQEYTKRPFEVSVEFELFPPTSEIHYGTGYYMGVTYSDGYETSVDVRYERTTDIITLATRYIEGNIGMKNLTHMEFTTEEE